jgi:catechol 2,3-dioxygenase-like lactoylglutathione lyase family enzyme
MSDDNRVDSPIRAPAVWSGCVKTLHTAYRVTDLAASPAFYAALGYEKVGHIAGGDGSGLTVLRLPEDQVGALELIHRPDDDSVAVGTGFGYVVVRVDDLASTVEALSQAGRRLALCCATQDRTALRRHGSQILTATTSNLSNGHLDNPTGSPLPTSARYLPQFVRRGRGVVPRLSSR